MYLLLSSESKEGQVRSEHIGKDMASVQALLTKHVRRHAHTALSDTERTSPHVLFQEMFESGLSSFQTEGIGSMNGMKTQLISQSHPQSKAIQQRHGDVMRHWEKLGKDSEAYKARLLRAMEQCRKVCV